MRKFFKLLVFVTTGVMAQDAAPYADIFQGHKDAEIFDAFAAIYGNPVFNLPFDQRPKTPLGSIIYAYYDLDEFQLFRASHQNTFANPTIENSFDYLIANEFDYNRLKPSLAEYRNSKFVLVPWPYFGNYDFKRSCMPTTEPYYDINDSRMMKFRMHTNLFYMSKFDESSRQGILADDYELGYPVVKKNLCLKVPADLAEAYFKPENYLLNQPETVPLILVKVSSEVYNPFNCRTIDGDASRKLRCRAEKWEKRKVKRLILQPVKYYLTIGGNIFKNF